MDSSNKSDTEAVALQRLQNIEKALDASAIVAITDPTGLITYVNDKFVELSQYSREELLGKDHRIINSGYHPKEFFRDLWKTITSGKVWRGEVRNKAKDGSLYWVAATITPLLDAKGNIEQFVAIRFDITERKRAEEALSQARIQLSASRDEALQAAQAKADFLANMSHEIRTPMNGVIGMIDLLRDTELNSRQREYVDTIQRSGETLLTIVNDILDFSKIEAGKMSLEAIPFNLRESVEDVVQTLAPSAHRKGVEIISLFHPDVPSSVTGDPFRFRQILLNLVGNAIKFTEKGDVSVRTEALEQRGGSVRVRLSVEDTGIGIAPEALGKLFSEFTQADSSTSRRFGGTGLGIAIAQRLAMLMGGTISVKSVVNKGTCFSLAVEWPLANSVRTEQALKPGTRFMIMHRHPLQREALSYPLLEMGGAVELVSSPEDALSVLSRAAREKQQIQGAFLDLAEKEFDGLTLVRQIRANPAFSELRVIGLSSKGSDERDETIARAGVNALLMMPFRRTRINEVLAKYFGSPASDKPAGNTITSPSVLPPAGRILLAEDNEVNQKVAAAILQKLGYSVDIVADGKAAVDAVKNKQYLAVLMDCQMPGMDGFQATALIRAQHIPHPLPIVAVTGNALAGDRERVIQAGMDDYVTKPISLKSIEAVLSRVIKSSTPPPPTAPAIDGDARLEMSVLNSLRELQSPGQPDIVRTVVEVYLGEAASRMANILHAVAEGKPKDVADAVHALGGSSRSVGALRVGNLCKILEIDARNGSLSLAPELVRQIQEELHIAQSELKAIL